MTMTTSRPMNTRVRGMLATWLLLGAVAGPAGAQPTAAPSAPDSSTTLFYHAHVFTGEVEHPYAEAVAIRGDRIVAVGSLGEVERRAGTGARRIDLQGRFLMPGMIDAHAHPIHGGLSLLEAVYSDPKASVADVARFVAEQLNARASMRGDVLVIRGLSLSV